MEEGGSLAALVPPEDAILGLQISTHTEDFQEDHDDSGPLDEVYMPSKEDEASGKFVTGISNSPAFTLANAHEKAASIRLCLSNESSVVDLWKLRQMALSRGGLLSPALRSMAWPLLLGISTVEQKDDKDETTTTPVSCAIQKAVQEDTATTAWSSQEGRNQPDRFWYESLPSTTVVSSSSEATPGLALSSPCSSSEDTSTDESSPRGNSKAVSFSADKTTTTLEEPNNTPEEQAALQTLITMALAEIGSMESYPSGLSNVAVLLLVNLGASASLSSQGLSQLMNYPLQLQTRSTDMQQLLSSLGKDLNVVTPTKISLEALFSNSTLPVASRILDACLVSHPFFSLYLAVALNDNGNDWTMETVEHAIVTALEYMDRIPPTELLEASKTSSLSMPPTPAWALAATAPIEWVRRSSRQITTESDPIEEQQQKHQEIDFPDEATNDDWERLSTASIASDEDDDDHNMTSGMDQQETPRENLQKANFYNSYPMAITAAGLSTVSTSKKRSLAKQCATRRQRSLMACLVIVSMAAMTAFWSLGYLDGFSMHRHQQVVVPKKRALLPTPSSSSYTQKAIAAVVIPTTSRLVPTSPRSKHVVRKNSTRSSASPTATPQPEPHLPKYLAADTLLEWKEAAIVTASSPTTAPLAKPKNMGPLLRQLQKVGTFWRKITSLLFRRNKKQRKNSK